MIVVMLFHQSFGIMGKVGYLFGVYGHWGVDVFVFVSGFGLYWALARKKTAGVVDFYRRRLLRIVPAAVVAGIVLYLVGRAPWLGLVGLNLWYIRTILLLYLVAPLIYRLLVSRRPGLVMAGCVCVSVVGVLMGVPGLASCPFETQTTVTWTLSRLPAFAAGMFIARVNWDVKSLCNPRYAAFFSVALAALLYLHYRRHISGSFSSYLHLLPYILLALLVPGCCLLVSRAWSRVPEILRRLVEFFGIYSLEIYLVHEAVFREVAALTMPVYLKFLLGYGASVVLALLLHDAADWIMRGLRYVCGRLSLIFRQ